MITTFNHTNPSIFQSGIDVYYRVRAENGVGYGVYSDNLMVLTDSVPLNMDTPTCVSVTDTAIVLSWTSITADSDTGRDPINFY